MNEYNIPMPAPGETGVIPNSTLLKMSEDDDNYNQGGQAEEAEEADEQGFPDELD